MLLLDVFQSDEKRRKGNISVFLDGIELFSLFIFCFVFSSKKRENIFHFNCRYFVIRRTFILFSCLLMRVSLTYTRNDKFVEENQICYIYTRCVAKNARNSHFKLVCLNIKEFHWLFLYVWLFIASMTCSHIKIKHGIVTHTHEIVIFTAKW